MSSARTRFARFGFAIMSVAIATASIAARLGDQDGAAPAASPAPAAPTAPAADAAKPDAAKIEKGRELFAIWGCASCHALADADATGHVGPAFDHNPGLSHAFVVDRVTNGQGPMPSFGGQLTEEEISDLATYITAVATK